MKTVEHPATSLVIGGFVPFSATDYPDHLCAVVFCQGCPWRCGYCHNAHLQPRRGSEHIAWKDVVAFLGKRRGLLDAVVFSGGEPTLQRGLGSAMRAVRALGFKVGLHTAGVDPTRLAQVLPFTDWVGFDVKAAFERYEQVTRVRHSGTRARRSAELIVASGVAHEFRTTVDKTLLAADDLVRLRSQVHRMGANRYVLQPCRSVTS